MPAGEIGRGRREAQDVLARGFEPGRVGHRHPARAPHRDVFQALRRPAEPQAAALEAVAGVHPDPGHARAVLRRRARGGDGPVPAQGLKQLRAGKPGQGRGVLQGEDPVHYP